VFHFLGAAVARAWPLWLIGWLALLAVLVQTAPPWEEIAQDREFAFLPEDAPSQQGNRLLRQAFPNDQRASNIVIVLCRTDQELRDEDRSFVRDVVKPNLLQLAEEEGGLADEITPTKSTGTPPLIADIRTLLDRGMGALLVSADRQATLVLVELTTELLEIRNWPIVAKVEKLIAQWRERGQVPAGLELSLTGSATVGRDMTRGQRYSARATEFWTVALVIGMLVLIYRAPLLALIPLISVAMATQISLKLLSHLAQAGIVTLFEEVRIYITVILYGTGVDYCLFLIARYQEEREQGADWGDALAAAIGKVGAALTASAFTVICGIGMMVFAGFGKFHNAGITVAFSLVLGLCVVLTFTTSLLRLTGRWAFWPRTVLRTADVSVEETTTHWMPRISAWFSWQALGQGLLRRPALIWFVSVLLMSPLVVFGMVYADHVDFDFVRRLPADAPSVEGTNALQSHFPAGAAGIVMVLIHHPHEDFQIEDGKGQLQIEELTDRLKQEQTRLQLADIRSQALPLGITIASRQVFSVPLNELPKMRQQALRYYVSDAGALKGHVTRLELTMTLNPLSRQGIAWLNRMEEAIRSELPGHLQQAKLYFLGTTAEMRDLRQVTSRDQTLIQILVVISVLAILMILLRRAVVSLYLIASVLFSYYATLGAALALFWWLDPESFAGLDWKVPLFLFTILVAIGEDYNIFLMTRIAEEQGRHGRVEGIRVALVKTGRIITSCGIIMAGTFASLLAGSMQDLQHLGFALAFGVLVDTFIVRPIVVPAFLIVLERAQTFWSQLSTLVESASHRQEISRQRKSLNNRHDSGTGDA
jgi:RND superfamily putative drug exporter